MALSSIIEKLSMLHFKTESVLKYYLLVSLVAFVELSIASSMLLWGKPASPFHDMKDYLIPGRNFIWFIIVLLIMIRKRVNLSVLEKINLKYILLHLLSLSVFIVCGLYAVNNYPFPPLGPDNLIVKAARLIRGEVDDHTIRFSLLFLIITLCCHYTLFNAVIGNKKIYYKYLYAMPLAFCLGVIFKHPFNYIWQNIISVLWKYLSYGVSRAVYLLLKLSGFKPMLMFNTEGVPWLGVGHFNVEIGFPCSGFQGIITFFVGFGMVLLFGQKKTDLTKACIVAYLGVFSMYVANILRIYILILIGYLYNPKFAINFWHSEGSIVFYAIVIIIVLKVSNRWLTESTLQDK